MSLNQEPSWRKPVGVLLVLLLIALWSVAVVVAAEAMGLGPIAAALFYVVGGFAWLWLLPIKRLLRWMAG